MPLYRMKLAGRQSPIDGELQPFKLRCLIYIYKRGAAMFSERQEYIAMLGNIEVKIVTSKVQTMVNRRALTL